jgi:hypothetical protein
VGQIRVCINIFLCIRIIFIFRTVMSRVVSSILRKMRKCFHAFKMHAHVHTYDLTKNPTLPPYPNRYLTNSVVGVALQVPLHAHISNVGLNTSCILKLTPMFVLYDFIYILSSICIRIENYSFECNCQTLLFV